MNYPNPPSPEITTKEKPAFEEITSELLRELENALKPPKQKSQISLVFGMNALVPLGTIKPYE